MRDQATGRMVRVGGQKAVISTFRHETSRNLDPALHTHSVIANMLLGPDGKWRTMANERLYASKMLLGALYRSELAGDLAKLGYRIEKTHADGDSRSGASRANRRGVLLAPRRDRDGDGGPGTRRHGGNQHLARRAALMTRAHKRDVDKEALRGFWAKQASELGLDGKALVASAVERALQGPEKEGAREAGRTLRPGGAPGESHRPSLAGGPCEGGRRVGACPSLGARCGVREDRSSRRGTRLRPRLRVHRSHRAGRRGSHARGPRTRCAALKGGGGLTTQVAVARERETIALMRAGSGRGKAAIRGWMWIGTCARGRSRPGRNGR